MAESTSKLREEVAALTNVTGKGGVDIMADPTTFKSTYEIMREISQVWDQMSDINQSALLEKLAGKVRSNQVAALLTNFSHAEGALEVSQNSAGTMDKIYSTWMDSIEAREKQFTAAQQALSQVAYSADIKKGMLQAGTTGLGLLTTLIGGGQSTGWLGDLLSGGSGHVSGIGTLGLGASLMSVLGAFRTGNGNIWSGVGNFFGMHRGAGGELQRVNTDWVSAYNNALRDTGNKTSAMAAADAAIEKNGQVLDDWTRNLAESTDGVIDMSKATSGLSKVGQFAKSLGKNLVGGLAVAGVTALASWGISAIADLLDREVFHKSEHLAQTASTDYAEYEQAKTQAEASGQAVKTIKEEMGEIEKRRTAGQETAEDTRRYTQLQTQQRLAEIEAERDNRKRATAARKAFQSASASANYDFFGVGEFDTMLQQAALNYSFGTNQELREELAKYTASFTGTGPDYTMAQKTALANKLVEAGQLDANTVAMYASPGWSTYAQQNKQTYANQLKAANTLTDAQAEYAGSLFTLRDMSEQLSAEYVKSNPEAAVELFSEMSTLMQSAMALSGDESNNIKAATQENGALFKIRDFNDIQNKLPTMLGDAESIISDVFTDLRASMLTMLQTGKDQQGGLESVADTIAPFVSAYAAYQEMQYARPGSGKTKDQARYDLAMELLKEAGFEEGLNSLIDMAAAGKLNGDTFKETTKDLEGFSTILKLVGFDIQNGAEGFWEQIVKSATPETASGKPVTTAWETRRDAVNKVTAARATGKEVWAATGYTGVLSEENYQQIKNLGGAYMDAVEYTHGGLIFNKNTFDAAIHDEYEKQLKDLYKESAAKQSEYNAATAKVAELMAERAKELASGKESFSKQAELDNAVTAAAELGEQMRGYRRTAAQIQWQMGNAANWLSNKEGPEEGDEMREMSTAAAAIKAARKSGKIGTRQYAAAMQYLFGPGTTYSQLTQQDKNLITRMTKEDADSRQSAAAWQKEFQQAGILDENLAMKDGFSYQEMAAAYNKQFGTSVTADMMRGAVGMMNEYIEDQSKQYYVRDTDDYAFGGRGGAEFQRAQEALTQAMSDYKKTTADATATEAERAKAEKTLTEAMGAYAETAKTLGMTESQIADKIDETGKDVDQKDFYSMIGDAVANIASLMKQVADNTKPESKEEKKAEGESAEASGTGNEQADVPTAEGNPLAESESVKAREQAQKEADQIVAKAGREAQAAYAEQQKALGRIRSLASQEQAQKDELAKETAAQKQRRMDAEDAGHAALKAANAWAEGEGAQYYSAEHDALMQRLADLMDDETSTPSQIAHATQELNDAVAAQQQAAQIAETYVHKTTGREEAQKLGDERVVKNAQEAAEYVFDQAKERFDAVTGEAAEVMGQGYSKTLDQAYTDMLDNWPKATTAAELDEITADLQQAIETGRKEIAEARAQQQAETEARKQALIEANQQGKDAMAAAEAWQSEAPERRTKELSDAIDALDAALRTGKVDDIAQASAAVQAQITAEKQQAEADRQAREAAAQADLETARAEAEAAKADAAKWQDKSEHGYTKELSDAVDALNAAERSGDAYAIAQQAAAVQAQITKEQTQARAEAQRRDKLGTQLGDAQSQIGHALEQVGKYLSDADKQKLTDKQAELAEQRNQARSGELTDEQVETIVAGATDMAHAAYETGLKNSENSRQAKKLLGGIEGLMGVEGLTPQERSQLEEAQTTLRNAGYETLEAALTDAQETYDRIKESSEARPKLVEQAGNLINDLQGMIETGELTPKEEREFRQAQADLGDAIDSSSTEQLEATVKGAKELPNMDQLLKSRAAALGGLINLSKQMGELPDTVTTGIEDAEAALASGDASEMQEAYNYLFGQLDLMQKLKEYGDEMERLTAQQQETAEQTKALTDQEAAAKQAEKEANATKQDRDAILRGNMGMAFGEVPDTGEGVEQTVEASKEATSAAGQAMQQAAEAEAALKQRMQDAADLDRAERAEREAADAEASKADAVAKAQALLDKTVDAANQHPQGDKLTDAYVALDDALKGVKGKLTAGQIRELTKELNDAYAEATGGGAAEAEPAPSGSTISAERIPTQSNFTDMESVQMAMDGLHQTATEFEAAGHNLTQAQQDTLDDILGTTQQDYGSVAEATQAYDRARESMNELLGQYETGETDINARMRDGQNAAAQMAQTEETANLAEAAEAMSNTAGDMGRTVEAVGEEALAAPDAKNQAFEPQGAGAQGPQQSEQLVAPEVKVTVEQEPATVAAAPAAGATIQGTVAVEDFEVPDGTANITADTSGIGPAVASAVSSATSGGGSVSIAVTADTSEAMSAIAEVIAAAGQGVTIPVTASTQMAQAAEGEDYASNSTYLVDEEGAELIEHVNRGTYELGTNNGARFTKLDRGDIVHTAKETRRILRRGQAFAMGGVITGGARRSASDQGATFVSGAKLGNKDVSGGQGEDIGRALADAARAAGDAKAAAEAAAASAKSDSKNTALENLVKWFSKLMDWIPTYLDILKKKTQDFIKAADTAAHYIGKNSNLNGAVEGLAAELYANEQALAKYKAFMDEVQSKAGFIPDIDTIVQRIKEGSIDITQYSDENTVKFIQAYQKWWDKAKGCLDTIEGLTDQLRELSKQKLDNIVNYFQQIQSLLDAQVKTLDSLIERKEAYGKELYADDYAKQLQLHQDIIDSATEERAALLREMAEQMGISEDMMLRIVSGGKGVWDKLAKETQTGRILNPLDAPLPQQPEEKTEAPAEEQPAETPAPTEQQSPQYDELIKQLGSIGFISSEILKQNADVANATDATADVLSKQSGQSSSSNWEQIQGSGGTTKPTGGFFYGTGLSADLSFGEFAGDYKDIGGNTLSPGLDFTGGEEPEIVVSAVEITDEAIQAVADALQLDITSETDEAKANLEAIKHILSAGWENPLMVGSDVWYDFITQLETLQGSIIETEIEMQGLRDKMYEIPLNNLKTEYSYLERINAELEGINRMRDAQGSQAFAKTYRMLISNANKEIDCLEEQNKLLEQQLETLDPLSEKYQDIKKELDGNRDTIASIKMDQERWNDSIIDLQIAQLQKQNDAYKDQLSLMQALDELEKARQRRALVYHEDTGFVYEADEDEMEAAMEGVHDAVYQQMISDLERAKEDNNIYGPLGERLEQGGSILDYLGNTLVPVQDTLSGIDFTRYYQSIWDSAEQSGLLTAMLQSIDMAKLLQDSIGGGVNIDLSGMTLTGVDNVKELGDAIIQQLPNYLLQYLHGKGA